MNSRNRSLQIEEHPEQYDALLPREREILNLWDGGASHDEIAGSLHLAVKTVKDVVTAFDDRPDDSDSKMREGSAELRARILQFHPHVIFHGNK